MYIPRSYSEERPEELAAFIGAHPLGALVSSDGSGALFATHLPFLFDVAAGDHGVLTGHLARANPHHRLPRGDAEALVIFSGPEAYITPNWYPGRWTHGREVPTWNYIAVHAYGALRFIDDAEWLLPHLRRLTERSETTGVASPEAAPWRVDDAPAEYIAQMMKAIVGVEIRITRLEGKWKMSQNRTPETIAGVITGLSASSKPMDREVADIVAERASHARED